LPFGILLCMTAAATAASWNPQCRVRRGRRFFRLAHAWRIFAMAQAPGPPV
jgi:hypothetical protein